MDFEEAEWQCDNKTDKLVTSLFGTPSSEGNKHKGIPENSTDLNYNTVEGYRKYLLSRQHMNNDDDDAVVSKKERKRIKEKRRKKNKRSGESYKEEECDFSDDAASLERHIKEINLIKDEMSDKLKKKNKQLHVGSSINCGDDSVRDDSKSKTRKRKNKYLSLSSSQNCGDNSVHSDSKSKRKNQQLHVGSSRNCSDDSIQFNPKSKRKAVKHSSDGSFKVLTSSQLSSNDGGAQNDSKLKKRKVKKKFVESTDKSINSSFVSTEILKQRDSICGITQTVLNKDTSLEETKKSSIKKKRKRPCKRNKYKHLVISNPESNPTICDSTADKQHSSTTIESGKTKNVEKSKKYKEDENSCSLSIGKDKKRKLIDNVSNDINRTSNEPEIDSVPTKKRKKSVVKKSSINQEEMVSNQVKRHDKSQKKNVLSMKQNSKETFERNSATERHTPGKNKLHYNIEKLRAHLGINNKEADEKLNHKLKPEKLGVSKSFESVNPHMDSNKRKVDNSSTFPKNVVATKKRKIKDMSLRERMLDRLSSARFRYLSEQMYTQTGSEAKTLFENDKEAFEVYHEGYQAQVNKWPLSPVNVIIQEIKKKPADLVVADFGCGEAILAQSVPNIVHSFDLVALNEHVTACDMAKVPLSSGSVDIAVFCLSLMGTNLTDYLCEASRVLKNEGLLKIAEVASRFDKPSRFVHGVERMGFRLTKKNTKNKMFYLFDFVKTGNVKKDAIPQIELNPCLYKRR